MSNGDQSIGLKLTLTGSVTEYLVPGLGIVKYDDVQGVRGSAGGEDIKESSTSHAVLTKRPVDTL
jgi:hypothetical protein